MHFLLLLLRMLLDQFGFHGGDGLRMAARADGRIEHFRMRPSFWDRWWGRLEFRAPGRRFSGLKVRAASGHPRFSAPAGPESPPAA